MGGIAKVVGRFLATDVPYQSQQNNGSDKVA